MKTIRKDLRSYKSDKETPLLYDVDGHINITVKNLESIHNSLSFRQLVQSLPPVIIGDMIYQHEGWIHTGALMAEHLTTKFVPRALNWIKNMKMNSMELGYHFMTHIKGYSSRSYQKKSDQESALHGTSIAEWNDYPYRVDYKFHFNISSIAKENYKWLGYKNYAGFKSHDRRYENYMQAIINSQSTEIVHDYKYDIDKAIRAIMFLVQ